MAAYTDADLEVALEAYFKKHSGLARDCVEAALDAVAPAIAARALREFAAATLATYPEDVWPEPTGFGDSIDRRSASVARLIARQAESRAADIERTP